MNVVTGAFGYTGRYITSQLLSLGERVRTLTGHPGPENPFGGQVEAFPFNFDKPAALVEALRGATTLYNTYWIRFPRGEITVDKVVENTRILIEAAEKAGVRRLVHISITNAAEDSSLPYFRGKGLVERAIIESKMSYAIIRPTVIFGREDILINNIAWLLRRFPLFAMAGRGDYCIQPVYVEDVAQIAVQAAQRGDSLVMDAVGPEVYSFHELVALIAGKLNTRTRIVHVPAGLVIFLAKMLGYLVQDVLLTRDEVLGLMSNLLISQGFPTGETLFSEWLAQNANSVGAGYASELRRHYR